MTLRIWLPRYYRIFRRGKEAYLRLKESEPAEGVRFEERWGRKERCRLWQKFYELRDKKEVLEFASRYGVLGRPVESLFAGTGLPSLEQKSEWEKNRAGLLSGELSPPGEGPVCSREEALRRNPLPFQGSLWPEEPEPVSWWIDAQRGLGALWGLCNALLVLGVERHGEAKAREKVRKRGAGVTACSLLTRSLQTIEGLLGERLIDEKACEIRNRIEIGHRTVKVLSARILSQGGICLEETDGPGWTFILHWDAPDLITLLFMDMLFHQSNLEGFVGPHRRLCANQEGRRPCPNLAVAGGKYCERQRCLWAAKQRRHRAKQATSCQESKG